MSQENVVGALSELGVSPLPIGTLAEIEQAGLDPENVASCHPEQPSRGIRGCPLWKKCPFGQQKMGGFKGKTGPHYIGYFLMTHEGRKKEDTISCHGFVRTLLGRANQAQSDKQEGRAHEIVRVVAQEGESIIVRVAVPDDPLNTNINAKYHFEVKEIEVAAMPRPGELGDVDYDQRLTKRELERQASEQNFEDESFHRMGRDGDGERFETGKKLAKRGRLKRAADSDGDESDELYAEVKPA